MSSLFTKVPIDEAVQIIQDRLRKDETLCDRTTLSPDRVAELLEVCLRSTYFCYKGTFNERQEGAAMRSPVSTAVANLYMESFEELALKSAPVTPPALEEVRRRHLLHHEEGHGRGTPGPPQQCTPIHQVHG